MNLAIHHGCVVVTQTEPVMPPPGPVAMPSLRTNVGGDGLLRQVDGPAAAPRPVGIFASPAVAARTLNFFGGKTS